MAAGLRRAVREASNDSEAIGSSLPVQHDAVLLCRDELLDLARRLQSAEPARAAGVTLASELLTNADSPLYKASGDLGAAVRRALAALEG